MFNEIEFRCDSADAPQPQLASSPMEIARSLANLSCYPGQAIKFYSVAQHNVLLSRIVAPHLAMQALFQSPPVFSTSLLESKGVEMRNVRGYVEGMFRSSWTHPEISRAEALLKSVEQRDLQQLTGRRPVDPTEIVFGPLPTRIEPVAPEEAYQMFIARHRLLALKNELIVQEQMASKPSQGSRRVRRLA